MYERVENSLIYLIVPYIDKAMNQMILELTVM